jgi:hypothetical protein
MNHKEQLFLIGQQNDMEVLRQVVNPKVFFSSITGRAEYGAVLESR